MNLISNAVKFSAGNKAGTITIDGTVHIKRMNRSSNTGLNDIDTTGAMNVDQTFLKISITDEGIGISKKECSQIFTPFYRTKDNISLELNQKGNGIGLSICK